MLQLRITLATLFVAALVGCEGGPVAPLSPVVPRAAGVSGRFSDVGGPVSATGGGHYDLGGLTVQFAFSAVQPSNGSVAGEFHHYADEGGGLVIDFYGSVPFPTTHPSQTHPRVRRTVPQHNLLEPHFPR